MNSAEKDPGGNTIKLILLLGFVGSTFYQFLTYAQKFNLSDFLPQVRNSSTVLYGVAGTYVVPTPPSIGPALLLIALNITLWVERPAKIRHVPLILTFIANLSIVLLQVGIAAPQLKTAAPHIDTWTLSALEANWNVVYLILAAISALIVLGMLIHFLRHDELISPYLSPIIEKLPAWKPPSVPNKIRLALFLVFAVLIFYQFATYAKPVHRDASKVKNSISQIELSKVRSVDIAVTVVPRSVFITLIPALIVVLNVFLWILYPQQTRRLLLTLSLLANLAIIAIQNNTEAAFQRAGGFQGMSIEARFLQLDQSDNLYRILTTISAVLVIGILIQIWRKPRFRPYSQR